MNLLRFTLLALAVAAGVAPLSAQPKDNYGDPLPEGAKARIGTARMAKSGGGAEWMGATLTPDGKYLLSAIHDGELERLDVTTGKRVGTIGEKIPKRDGRESLRLSADGKRGMSTLPSEIVVWDVESGRVIARFAGAKSGTLSADGKFLAVGDAADPLPGVPGRPGGPGGSPGGPRGQGTPPGGPPGGPEPDKPKGKPRPLTVVVWDVDKKEKRREVAVTEDESVSVALSPDGTVLATWGAMRHEAKGHSEYPPPPADTPVRFWDVASGKPLAVVTLKQSSPTAVIFAPDGKTVAVGNSDGAVLLIDPKTGATRPLVGDGAATPLTFSPDGKTLATGMASAVRLWDVDRATVVSTTKSPVQYMTMQVVFAGAGTAVAWTVDGSQAVVWEVPSGKVLSPYGGHLAGLYSLVFTPDGKELLSTPTNYKAWTVNRWDPATGKLLGILVLEPPPNINLPGFRALTLLPDGKTARATAGEVSYLYDVPTGKRLHDFNLSGRGNSSHLSTDGKLLLTPIGVKPGELADRTKPLKHTVQERGTDKQYPDLELPAPSLLEARPSADHTRLVTHVTVPVPGEEIYQLLTLWELATGKKLGEVKFPGGGHMGAIGTGPNATVLAYSKTGKLLALDLVTGKVLHEMDIGGLIPHGGPVFSPDGKRFAVGLYHTKTFLDGPHEVRVYDVGSGQLLKTFLGHEGLVSLLAFSPDGKLLASGSYDTTVLLWDLSTIPAVK